MVGLRYLNIFGIGNDFVKQFCNAAQHILIAYIDRGFEMCIRDRLYGNTFSTTEVRLITESADFAARLPRLFQRAFGLKFDRLPEEERGKLIFGITDRSKLDRISNQLGDDPRQNLVRHVNFGLLEDECCRTAFLRGAFLAGGSVTDPEKRYHLELDTGHAQASREVAALLTEMGFLPHSVRRGGSSVIYFKQSEHIEDLLTTIGAPAGAMDIMTAKVDKMCRRDRLGSIDSPGRRTTPFNHPR